jgi:hypothetical protein
VPTDAVRPTNTDTAATPKSPERQTRQGQIGRAAALTQGQMNAVRAAFKAGVTPSKDCPAIRPISLGGSQSSLIRRTQTMMMMMSDVSSQGHGTVA